MFVPHFSQRRTVSRGACICSSASRSRRRFPTAAAAPPAPALPIARWRTGLIIAAPFGSRTPAAHYSVACTSGRVVHFPYRCGTLRPTPTRCPSSDGTPRRPNARGGFRPANAARTLPHSSPTCDVQEANLFIQVSVKSISASCRRTHRPPLRAVGHHPAGIGAVCSSFLSAPRRRGSNGPFFHLQVLPVLAAPPASPSGIRPRGAAPSAARRPFPHDPPPRSPRNPDCAAVCPHPFTPFIPPIARAPRL